MYGSECIEHRCLGLLQFRDCGGNRETDRIGLLLWGRDKGEIREIRGQDT
jgi:hypothetical protein